MLKVGVRMRLQLLDYGRFVSICFVVAFHYFFNGVNGGKIDSIVNTQSVVDFVKYGYLGVEFFFMISGYVIFFSAHGKSAAQFVTARAVRLIPAFYFCCTFTALIAMLIGSGLMKVSLGMFLANLTMMPGLFGMGFVDGVYWSLGFEIKFYILVFVILFFGGKDKLDLIFLAWPFIILMATVFGVDRYIYLGGYYSYFAAGALLAVLTRRADFFSCASLFVAYGLCIDFSTSRASSLYGGEGFLSVPIVFLLVSMFFLFFIFLNSKWGQSVELSGSKYLGSITYPLYLIHAHVGYMLISKFASESNKLGVYLFVLFFVFVVSAVVNYFVEQRFYGFFRKLFFLIVGRPVEALNGKIFLIDRWWSRFSLQLKNIFKP